MSTIKVACRPCWKINSNSRVSSCTSLYRAVSKYPNIQLLEATLKTILLDNYDILHLHWPESILNARFSVIRFLKLLSFIICIEIVNLKGVKIVWTAHNLCSHESKEGLIDFLYWKYFLRNVNLVLSPNPLLYELTSSDKRLALATKVCTPYADARLILDYYDESSICYSDQNKDYILAFGYVRKYKGFDRLCKVATHIPDKNFLIVGKALDAEYAAQFSKSIFPIKNLSWHNEHVKDSMLIRYIKNALLVVFPFYMSGNSATIRLALTLKKHVVVQDSPMSRMYQNHFGSEWITLCDFDQPADCAYAVRSAASKPTIGNPDWGNWRWENVAKETVKAYSSILS